MDSQRDHDRLLALRGFTEVAQAGSFTKASDALGVRNSTLSRRVAGLEQDLGVQLLTRTTRTVALTEAGTIYLERAKQLLRDLDESDRMVQDFAAGVGGTLRVNAPTTFARTHVTPHVPEFLHRYPSITIELTLADRVLDIVHEQADISIQIGEPAKKEYVIRRILGNERVLVASPAYLAERGEPRNPNELRAHSCLVLPRYLVNDVWMLTRGGEQQGIQVRGCFRANNGEALLHATMGNCGIALLSRFVVDEPLSRGELVRVLPEWAHLPGADVYAVMPPHRYLTRRVRLFIDHLHSKYEEAQRVRTPPVADSRKKPRVR